MIRQFLDVIQIEPFITAQSGSFNKEFSLENNKALRITLKNTFRQIHQRLKKVLRKEDGLDDPIFSGICIVANDYKKTSEKDVSDILAVHVGSERKITGIAGS